MATKYVTEALSRYRPQDEPTSDTKSALNKSILDAINVISQNNVKTSNATLTIEGTITAIEDAGLGIYKVNYRDNSFTAQSSSGVSYKVGDVVYILVPEGDFSKPKMILGNITNTASTVVDEDVDDYIRLTDNSLIEIPDYSLCSYHTYEETISLGSDFVYALDNQIAGQYKDLALSAIITTNLSSEQQKNGNYGIKISIPIARQADDDTYVEHSIKEIILDINSMQGYPYGLTKDTLQIVKQTLDKNYQIDYDERDKATFTVFVKDFNESESINIPDIFIKDIRFDVITYLTDAERQGCYLSLSASEGPFFVKDSSEYKTITPLLKINGKTTKIDGYECYQFLEDNFINTTTNPNYFPMGGLGQKCLNNKAEDGSFITTSYSLEINKKDIYSISRYKCILIKNSISISATIDIENLLKEQKFELTTDASTYAEDTNQALLTAKLISYKKEIDQNNISVAYTRYDIDGDPFYTQPTLEEAKVIYNDEIGQQEYEEKVSIPISSVDRLNTIRCTFYYTYTEYYEDDLGNLIPGDKIINLGSTSTTIIIDNEGLTLAIQNGDILYKYDIDGNSPFVYNNKSVITPLTFKIYKTDGTEFNEGEYSYCKCTQRVPVNSMLKVESDKTDGTYYYVNHRILNYNILETFDATKTNNSISLSVQVNKLENILQDNTNINFIKDGEYDANGSKYTAIIGYKHPNPNIDDYFGYGQVDDNGNIIKFQVAYIRGLDNKQYYSEIIKNTQEKEERQIHEADQLDSFNFGIKLYCDGQEVKDKSIYNIDQHIFNESNSQSVLKIQGDEIRINTDIEISDRNEELYNTTILAAEITITDNDSDPDYIIKEKIYAYYPIEFVVIDLRDIIPEEREEIVELIRIPHITGGFDKVVYDNQGMNPSYNNTDIFKIDNCVITLPKIEAEEEDIEVIKNNQSCGNNFTSSEEELKNNEYKIVPTTNYTGVALKPQYLNYIRDITQINEESKEVIQNRIEEIGNENTGLIKNLIDNKNIINEFVNNTEETKNNLRNFMKRKDDIINNVTEILNNIKRKDVSSYMKDIINMRQNLTQLLEEVNNSILTIQQYLYSYFKDTETWGNDYLNESWLKEKALQNCPKDSRIFTNISLFTIIDYTKNREEAIELINSLSHSNEEIKSGLTPLYLDFCTKVNTFNTILQDNQILARLKQSGQQEALQRLIYEPILSFKTDFFVPEGLTNDVFINLIKFPEMVTPIINRILDPLNNSSEIQTQEEASTKIKMLYGNEYPLYGQIDDFLYKLIPDINIVLNEQKDLEYYIKVGNQAIEQLNQEIIDLQNLSLEYTEALNYYKYPNFVILKPIIMIIENKNLAIDGYVDNVIAIKTERPEPDLVPEVCGMGSINDNGNFTGTVIGSKISTIQQETRSKRSVSTEVTKQNGLFSYNNGTQSLYLSADDGSSLIGTREAGQVLSDPNSRTVLYSSNYQKNYNVDGKPQSYEDDNRTENQKGILIDLTNSDIELTYQDPITEQQQTKSILDIVSSGSDSRVDQLIEQVSRLTIQVQELQSQLSTVSAELNNRIPAHESDTETINIKFN